MLQIDIFTYIILCIDIMVVTGNHDHATKHKPTEMPVVAKTKGDQILFQGRIPIKVVTSYANLHSRSLTLCLR